LAGCVQIHRSADWRRGSLVTFEVHCTKSSGLAIAAGLCTASAKQGPEL
jgi:hypothetical protein